MVNKKMTAPIMNDNTYQAQLANKVARIQKQFACFEPPMLEIHQSPISHFRMRAEFRIWHSDDDMFYAMFERDEAGKKTVIRLDEFPIATRQINELMSVLLTELKANAVLSERIFEIHFLNTLKGDMLVSLIYHKKLDQTWQDLAGALADRLGIKIIGRSRGQKIVISDDFVIEQMTVEVQGGKQTFYYQQIEGGFSQPNAQVCQAMLNFACDVADSIANKQDLLELYCGNGNFTLPLSGYFKKVLATELSKSSVNAARWAITHNGISNIDIARLSAEDFGQAHKGVREFRRLLEAGIDMNDYAFNTVFVDPPRAGVDDQTLKILQDFDNIIYISCNPDTLFDNLLTLTQTHDIRRMALFDQFPYTHHIESGVWLSRRM